jgi:tetratricopeptide (TPR) repeat protein
LGDPHLALARFFQEQGNLENTKASYQEACESFQQAITLKATPEAYYGLGATMASLNQLDKAEQNFRTRYRASAKLFSSTKPIKHRITKTWKVG